MKGIKKYLHRVFIDGFSGMALGLFSTLIIGTIVGQIAKFVPGAVGMYMIYASNIAKSLMGAGIGAGVAGKYKEGPIVTVSAAVAGMIGAFPMAFAAGDAQTVLTAAINLGTPGNPLSAFIAAYAAIEVGHLISGKTPVDIIVTPLATIAVGAVIAFITGPYINTFTGWLGTLITINVEAHPFIGGIIVSALMGIFLTLPISSAAIGVVLGLDGLAAGAATIGCCCQMVGFAVMSYRENKMGGLISQGIGTSMLQMGNIIKNPKIWIAPILTSAITGPLATCVFHLQMNGTPVSSGMGTCGFVGQIGVYSGWVKDISEGTKAAITAQDWIGLILISFVLPAVICPLINLILRKIGWVKDGDLKLE